MAFSCQVSEAFPPEINFINLLNEPTHLKIRLPSLQNLIHNESIWTQLEQLKYLCDNGRVCNIDLSPDMKAKCHSIKGCVNAGDIQLLKLTRRSSLR